MLTEKNKAILVHGFLDDGEIELLVKNRRIPIVVLEGRPRFATSKSVCAKLNKRGVRPTLISDNMAGYLFYRSLVRGVCLSYQSSGDKDVWCPVGSLILAVLGKTHRVSVQAFPSPETQPLLGNPKDIMQFDGKPVAPKGIQGFVPLTERVPLKYISKIHYPIACV